MTATIEQLINDEWQVVTRPLDTSIAFAELHELSAANSDTAFRIRPESAGLARLHLDGWMRGGAVGKRFYVMCSCGQPFYGEDPGSASAAHGDHVDEVMPDPNSDDYLADGTVRVWAARRAAQALGIDSDTKALGEDDRDKIADAITDLLWLTNIVADELDATPAEIYHSAIFIYRSEKGDH